jgi:DNA modification methylase
MTLDQIICGDNVEVLSTLPDECIDLVVTSPPYDTLRVYGGFKLNFQNIASELIRVLKPGGVVVWVVADETVNGSETGSSFRQALWFMDNGMRLHDTMIYEKQQISFPDSTRYYSCWEYMFVLSKGAPKTFNPIKEKNPLAGKPVTATKRGRDGVLVKDSGLINGKMRPEMSVKRNLWRYVTGNVGGSADDKIAYEHPAIFPDALAKDHIASWSNPGDVILDPFAGSGTTLKAAKELNRHWLGIEINPAYLEICHKRLAQDVLKLEDVK